MIFREVSVDMNLPGGLKKNQRIEWVYWVLPIDLYQLFALLFFWRSNVHICDTVTINGHSFLAAKTEKAEFLIDWILILLGKPFLNFLLSFCFETIAYIYRNAWSVFVPAWWLIFSAGAGDSGHKDSEFYSRRIIIAFLCAQNPYLSGRKVTLSS